MMAFDIDNFHDNISKLQNGIDGIMNYIDNDPIQNSIAENGNAHYFKKEDFRVGLQEVSISINSRITRIRKISDLPEELTKMINEIDIAIQTILTYGKQYIVVYYYGADNEDFEDDKKRLYSLIENIDVRAEELSQNKSQTSTPISHLQQKVQLKPSSIPKKTPSITTAQKTSKLCLPLDHNKKHHIFLSHASEDKAEFVDELYAEMIKQGLEVWYDREILTIGDSLNKKLDQGLQDSLFAVVVLSPSFVKKQWTIFELDGAFTKELDSGKYILPIWHNITFEEVKEHNFRLSNKLAGFSNEGVEILTQKIIKAVNQKTPYSR